MTKKTLFSNQIENAEVITTDHVSVCNNTVNSLNNNLNVKEEKEEKEHNEIKMKPSYSTTPSLHSILSRDKKGTLTTSFSSSVQPSDDDYVINLIENIEIPVQENLKVV